MRERDLVMEHAATLMFNIRKTWPGLTGPDVQTMDAGRCSVHHHRGARDHVGASMIRLSTH